MVKHIVKHARAPATNPLKAGTANTIVGITSNTLPIPTLPQLLNQTGQAPTSPPEPGLPIPAYLKPIALALAQSFEDSILELELGAGAKPSHPITFLVNGTMTTLIDSVHGYWKLCNRGIDSGINKAKWELRKQMLDSAGSVFRVVAHGINVDKFGDKMRLLQWVERNLREEGYLKLEKVSAVSGSSTKCGDASYVM